MNDSGQHFKNSIFYVYRSHLNIIVKGRNIVTSEYDKVALLLGDFVYLIPTSLKWILKGIKEYKRSREDSVFVVDEIADNMSVFRFEGDNLTVSGLGVILKQNTSAVAYNIICGHSCFSDLYVKS